MSVPPPQDPQQGPYSSDAYGQNPQPQSSSQAPYSSAPYGGPVDPSAAPATPPNRTGRTVGIVCGALALIAVLLIGGGIALWALNRGGDDPAPTPDPATTPVASTEPAESPTPAETTPAATTPAPSDAPSASDPASSEPAAGGLEGDAGGVKYTLASARVGSVSSAPLGDGDARVEPTGRFLSTQVQVTNTTSEAVQPDPAVLSLVLADGTVVPAAGYDALASDDEQSVAAGEKSRTYNVYWDVPADAEVVAIRMGLGSASHDIPLS